MTEQTSKPGSSYTHHVLQSPLELPCGAVLKNRLAKSPMSDSLGDGAGDSTEAQARLYERWAQGGTAVSIIEKLGAERNGSYLSESLRAKRSNLPNDNK